MFGDGIEFTESSNRHKSDLEWLIVMMVVGNRKSAFVIINKTDTSLKENKIGMQ